MMRPTSSDHTHLIPPEMGVKVDKPRHVDEENMRSGPRGTCLIISMGRQAKPSRMQDDVGVSQRSSTGTVTKDELGLSRLVPEV